MNVLMQLRGEESGATMVEYAIMLAFIAAVCITVVLALGGATSNEFSSFNSSFSSQ